MGRSRALLAPSYRDMSLQMAPATGIELPNVRRKTRCVNRAVSCSDADRLRRNPALGDALYRAATGRGRIRDATGGYGRTAAAPGGAATLPARETHRGRQGGLHLRGSRREPL